MIGISFEKQQIEAEAAERATRRNRKKIPENRKRDNFFFASASPRHHRRCLDLLFFETDLSQIWQDLEVHRYITPDVKTESTSMKNQARKIAKKRKKCKETTKKLWRFFSLDFSLVYVGLFLTSGFIYRQCARPCQIRLESISKYRWWRATSDTSAWEAWLVCFFNFFNF